MLASIQKIENIEPIQDADNLETAYVLGWTCVIPKNTFHVGDRCIYIEIDTLVPGSYIDKPDEKILVRSLKLRGVLSQGLVLVLSKFPQCDLPIGSDVSHLLDVTHFEKNTEGKEINYKGSFPRFMSKTDEPMVQSEPELIAELMGKPYYITIKFNGSSSTFYNYDGNEFGVCSRRVELFEMEGCPFWTVYRKYGLEYKMPNFVALQGETCGPNISKNKMKLTEYMLKVFNVFDIRRGRKYPYKEMVTYLKNRDIPMVDILEDGESFNYTIEQLKEMASTVRWNGQRVEGIVVRSQDQKISFKVLNNEYLLKNKE